MSDSPLIVHLQPEEKEQAVEVITAAFYNYPVLRFFLDGETAQAYNHKLKLMVDFFCQQQYWMDWPPLVVRVGQKTVAVALVNPPIDPPKKPEEKEALHWLQEVVGPTPITKMRAYGETCRQIQVDAPHYYLSMFAVLPDNQGQGYGRLLLEHLHQIVDADPLAAGIALNTETPKNVPLYRLFGYDVIGEDDLGPIHTWAMFRPSSSTG